MNDDRLEAVMQMASAAGAGAALLSSRASIRWLGADGARHVLISGGDAVVIAPEERVAGDRGAAEPRRAGVERFSAGRGETVAAALARALARVDLGPWDPVAVESAQLSPTLVRLLGSDVCRDIGGALAGAQACKDAGEIAAITRAAELAAAGQQALRAALEPGMTELELWARAHAALAEAAGGEVEARVELMAGSRTTLIGAPPGAHVVAAGDPLLFALSPRHEGYWADSCATLSCGPPGARLRRRHAVVRRALECGLRAARPGARAGDVDRAIRDQLDRGGLDCPHATGHGVGTAAQEGPRLLPGSRHLLKAGMVLTLEPGAYDGDAGVRLAQTAVVTAAGAEPLAPHPLELA